MSGRTGWLSPYMKNCSSCSVTCRQYSYRLGLDTHDDKQVFGCNGNINRFPFPLRRNAGVLFEDIRVQDPPDECVPPQQQGGGSERGRGERARIAKEKQEGKGTPRQSLGAPTR